MIIVTFFLAVVFVIEPILYCKNTPIFINLYNRKKKTKRNGVEMSGGMQSRGTRNRTLLKVIILGDSGCVFFFPRFCFLWLS